MSFFARMRPSPAMVVAVVALVVAVGGTAWAVATVTSADIVNNTIKAKDLKTDKGVKDSKVVPDSLTGRVINESTLGNVPSATNATNADNAQNAQNADKLGGQPPSAFASSSSEAYREVGAAAQPAFGAGWSNEDPVNETTTAFYKDPLGVVHLKGTVARSGGGITIFTLPADYRPTKQACFPSIRSVPTVAVAYICVTASGLVQEAALNTDGSYLLDGLTFRAGAG